MRLQRFLGHAHRHRELAAAAADAGSPTSRI
jgi:hypothetical protein